jgi:hypothetical protein
MTHEEKLEKAISYLESLGNTEEDAVELLANLIHDATMRLPQRGWNSDIYCNLKKDQKNTAMVQLRKLPFGEEILKEELKHC